MQKRSSQFLKVFTQFCKEEKEEDLHYKERAIESVLDELDNGPIWNPFIGVQLLTDGTLSLAGFKMRPPTMFSLSVDTLWYRAINDATEHRQHCRKFPCKVRLNFTISPCLSIQGLNNQLLGN